MGDTWIVDITHYEDILDPALDVPGTARRLGEYFGTIVGAAQANDDEVDLWGSEEDLDDLFDVVAGVAPAWFSLAQASYF